MISTKKQTLYRREKSEFSLQMDALGMQLEPRTARSMGPATDEVVRA